jgi:ATP-dependent phosphoenolpyruvate carboxykinase
VIVEEAEASDVICWGEVNIPCQPALFDRLLDKARGYLHTRDLYVFDGFAGAERTYRLPIRVVPTPVRASSPNTLFVRPPRSNWRLRPRLHRDQSGLRQLRLRCTRSSVFIGISLRKSSHLRHLRRRDEEVDLQRHELPAAAAKRASMHCSADVGLSAMSTVVGLVRNGKRRRYHDRTA